MKGGSGNNSVVYWNCSPDERRFWKQLCCLLELLNRWKRKGNYVERCPIANESEVPRNLSGRRDLSHAEWNSAPEQIVLF
jgi:hypothetical protein